MTRSKEEKTNLKRSQENVGSCYLVLGSYFLDLEICDLEFILFGSWVLVLGIYFLVLGS